MLKNRKAASTTEYGLIMGLIAVGIIVAVQSTGDEVNRVFGGVTSELNGVTNGTGNSGGSGNQGPVDNTSCKTLSETGGLTSGEGVYTVTGSGSMLNVYCKGAATLVAAMFENDPFANWNESPLADYDPSLASSRSFTLSSGQIPSHGKVYFGQGVGGSALRYCVNYNYTTGDIARTAVTDCTNSNSLYWLHREANAIYRGHNPDEDYFSGGSSVWYNSLILDLHTNNGSRSTGRDANWIVAPFHTTPAIRGYAFNGSEVHSSNNSQAWTVWVE